ncbi:MAG: tripartite tricarboxylate transporter TctB family protein [Candidatus Methylomirabilota bacterium]
MITKTADIIVAAMLLCLGVIVGWDSYRLGSGWGPEGPKAGFFPLVMAVVAIVGCLVVIRQAMAGTSSVKGGKLFVPAGGMKPVLTVFIPACGMILLTEVVGLYVAAMIYLAAYIKVVGEYKWSTVLLVSIPIPLLFYWVFEKIFLIPMPAGMFGAQILRF